MSIVNLQQASMEKPLTDLAYRPPVTESASTAFPATLTSTNQLILASKLTPHRPEAGLNPLVDAAASLFSMMGKMRQLKTCDDFNELHHELVQQMAYFQQALQNSPYTVEHLSEYIPITLYALCATLDDVIASTPWGGQGKWQPYSLVVAFNQESISQKSFFIILERLVRDPAIYIDVMEFMYICLSLGFRCHYHPQSSELDHVQLEHITTVLYKRIRAYRGHFSKHLSPFPLKTPRTFVASSLRIMPAWIAVALAGALFVVLLVAGKYMLDNAYQQTSQLIAQANPVEAHANHS